MQHLLIRYDEETQVPFIIPYKGHLWRDDQSVMWSFAAPNVRWDPDPPNPEKGPIQFRPADPGTGVSAWPGSQPAPVGPAMVPDRRRYVADGGAPNLGSTTILYMYDAYVEWETFTERGDMVVHRGKVQARPQHEQFAHIEPIDPEILNEPQP